MSFILNIYVSPGTKYPRDAHCINYTRRYVTYFPENNEFHMFDADGIWFYTRSCQFREMSMPDIHIQVTRSRSRNASWNIFLNLSYTKCAERVKFHILRKNNREGRERKHICMCVHVICINHVGRISWHPERFGNESSSRIVSSFFIGVYINR